MGLPVIDLSRVVEWGLTAVAEAAKWIAQKALIMTILFVLMPIAVWNMRKLFFDTLLPIVLDQLNIDPIVLEYTGLAGWFVLKMKLDVCLGIILAGCVSRLSIRMILR